MEISVAKKKLDQLFREGADFLGCKLPIMAGAMTWLSERHLVSAISEAGGFGVIACGSISQHGTSPPALNCSVVEQCT